MMDMMAYDRFEKNFKPLELIRNITATITLGPDRYAYSGGYGSTLTDIRRLFVLSNGAQLHLLINCQRSTMAHEYPRLLEAFLDMVQPTLLKLRRKYKLHISLEKDVYLLRADQKEHIRKASEILWMFIEQLESEVNKTP
jgi:hypothetical protein